MKFIRAATLLSLVFASGCDKGQESAPDVSQSPSASVEESTAEGLKKDAGDLPKEGPVEPQDSGKSAGPSESAGPSKSAECLGDMVKIPGGEFWVGTEREVYDREENPRFRARVANFCVDQLEVSTSEYEECVASGKCSEPHRGSKTCNSVKKGKGDHPINCIDYEQAKAVCGARGARLMTEIEWEYLARGGKEMREYPWGTAHPDGNTCWKHPGSCKRGSYTEEAFGLYDVVGNVWEWTDSWFGRYPWPTQSGRHKVYRGGSWSRRFEKWMKPTLRNRLDPKKSGSHLGVRCASTPPAVECAGAKTEAGGCHHEILEVQCLDNHEWNGVRCAKPGDERRCLPPAKEVTGFGCVRERISGSVDTKLDVEGVSRSRSPEFDADCQANSPGRPKAYKFVGGGHLARNVVGKQMGCKNRDVGVGFNSSCCP